MARPQEGDAFVFATGDRAGTPISEADLALGGPPVLARNLSFHSMKLINGALFFRQHL